MINLREHVVSLLTKVKEYLTSWQGTISLTSYYEPLPGPYTLNVKGIYAPKIKLSWWRSRHKIPVKISGYYFIEKLNPKSDGQKEMDFVFQSIKFRKSG